ncbi:MAG: formylglycine-generating enzyme family protein [Oligoflexus sp.]
MQYSLIFKLILSFLFLGISTAIFIVSPSKSNIIKEPSVVNGDSETTRQPSTEHENRKIVWIKGGIFSMGCADCGLHDALPIHKVEVDHFWMDETPVTNSAFQNFVKQTGYKTIAERALDPKDYPTVPPEDLVPGSAVFSPPIKIATLGNPLSWWKYVPGASWQHPEGPESDIVGRDKHPVVHIAYPDAQAYCHWAGKRLPTEAEYEYAARGGLHGKKYAWGDDLKPDGKWPANIWQGFFPIKNTAEDGYRWTSPVHSFPPNGYGLYDMGGNVWQWTSDWYRPDTYTQAAANGMVQNPQGPSTSFDPNEPDVPKRVQRGGSFLCSDRYCTRYLVGSRGKGAVNSAGSNIGFRCVKDEKEKK